MNLPETDGEQLACQPVRVGTVAQFVEKSERVVTTVNGAAVLVLAVGKTIYAVGNRCTHLPFRLARGLIVTETAEIECPLHEGRFSLATGEATREPCEKPIPTYRVIQIGDDVYVDGSQITRPDRIP